jgi:ATP-dependent RNA helicase DDX24/MAK5
MGMKRGREGRGPADKSKKKPKVQAQSGAANPDPAPPRIFGVDDLNWKSVPLPDRLDDLGGFFGLEEIDGVDVVRQKTAGDIKFKVDTALALEEEDLD